MEIRLKEPQGSYIESRYEGNEHGQYAWKEQSIEIRDAWMCQEAGATHIGKVVLIPFGNIAYIVMEP